MASDLEFVEYVCEQTRASGQIAFRKMFGEYAVYHEGKVVALVCGNQLFIKPTPAGRTFIDAVVEAPPYPGAKPYFLIADRLDDAEWLSELVRITGESLPPPKPKSSARRPRRG